MILETSWIDDLTREEYAGYLEASSILTLLWEQIEQADDLVEWEDDNCTEPLERLGNVSGRAFMILNNKKLRFSNTHPGARAIIAQLRLLLRGRSSWLHRKVRSRILLDRCGVKAEWTDNSWHYAAIYGRRLRCFLQHMSEDDPDFKINRGLFQLFRALNDFNRSAESDKSTKRILIKFFSQVERACLLFSVSSADLKCWTERACDKLSVETLGESFQSLYRHQRDRVTAFSELLEPFGDMRAQTKKYLTEPDTFNEDPFRRVLDNLDHAGVLLSRSDIAFAEGCLELLESEHLPLARGVISDMRLLNAAL